MAELCASVDCLHYDFLFAFLLELVSAASSTALDSWQRPHREHNWDHLPRNPNEHIWKVLGSESKMLHVTTLTYFYAWTHHENTAGSQLWIWLDGTSSPSPRPRCLQHTLQRSLQGMIIGGWISSLVIVGTNKYQLTFKKLGWLSMFIRFCYGIMISSFQKTGAPTCEFYWILIIQSWVGHIRTIWGSSCAGELRGHEGTAMGLSQYVGFKGLCLSLQEFPGPGRKTHAKIVHILRAWLGCKKLNQSPSSSIAFASIRTWWNSYT